MASAISDQGQALSNNASKDWERMTEDQRKEAFDKLPSDQKKGKSYLEWFKEGYHHQYENWMPWIEDTYLKWFTKDNKASYATKENLDKTKVTGVKQVDNLQDGANNLVAGQVGQGGLLQPAGDMVSKEGVNRAERGGKDESGSYGNVIADNAAGFGQSVSQGAQSASSYVTGMFGSKAEAKS